MKETGKAGAGAGDGAAGKAGGGPGIIDMLLGKDASSPGAADESTLMTDIQKRVWSSLKHGYTYDAPFEESDAFLREHILAKVDMAVLYADLVGSTAMTLEMSEERVATIISSFVHEMSYVVRRHGGYVLKFVGDAVIAYFNGENNTLMAADSAVECAKSMNKAVEKGINPLLNQYDYPDLSAKIGIDCGKVLVVRYGSDAQRSYVDLMGPVLNIAAKIQSHARPCQILVGSDVYERLHPAGRSAFREVRWKGGEWSYRSRITSQIYKVYEYAG